MTAEAPGTRNLPSLLARARRCPRLDRLRQVGSAEIREQLDVQFERDDGLGRSARPAVQAVAFGLGLAVTALSQRAGLHPRAIIFVSAAVTAAFSYLCGRALLR